MPPVSYLDQPVAQFQDFLRRQQDLQLRALENSQFKEPLLRAQVGELQSRTALREAQTQALGKTDPLANLNRLLKEEELRGRRLVNRGRVLQQQIDTEAFEKDILDPETEETARQTAIANLEKIREGILTSQANRKTIKAEQERLAKERKAPVTRKEAIEEFNIHLMGFFIDKIPGAADTDKPLTDPPETPKEVLSLLSRADQKLWLQTRRDLETIWKPNMSAQQAIDALRKKRLAKGRRGPVQGPPKPFQAQTVAQPAGPVGNMDNVLRQLPQGSTFIGINENGIPEFQVPGISEPVEFTGQ